MENFGAKDTITISLDKFGQAKYLSDCLLNAIQNNINSFTVNIKESFTGSNVCTPIAGIIDYYESIGVKFLKKVMLIM